MSTCPLAEICGGCRYRDMEENAYRELKKRHFATALKALGDISFRLNQPVFIPDGTRRRAVFNFAYRQQKLLLGFNEAASHRIIDIETCWLIIDNEGLRSKGIKNAFSKHPCASVGTIKSNLNSFI